MPKRRKKRWEKQQELGKKSEGEMVKLGSDSIHLQAAFNKTGETFLGFKRKNFNELWRWDTLEDVKF